MYNFGVSYQMSNVCCWPILLKNSIIWVRDFPGENQTTLNLTYK
jgi:hypothetical protein